MELMGCDLMRSRTTAVARRRQQLATPTGTQAVDRAARLVTEVVHAPDSVTFTELAAATGLAKSTTSRLLVALERGGLVRRDATAGSPPARCSSGTPGAAAPRPA